MFLAACGNCCKKSVTIYCDAYIISCMTERIGGGEQNL